MKTHFLVFLNRDANTEEETLTVDENLGIRTQKQKTSQNEPCNNINRSSRREVFLRKPALKICSKFTGELPYRSAISIKLFCNFIEIALRHGCSPINLLHIFRTPFLKSTSGRLLLYKVSSFLNIATIHLGDIAMFLSAWCISET